MAEMEEDEDGSKFYGVTPSNDSSRKLDASAREGRGELHEERRSAESATMMTMPPSDMTSIAPLCIQILWRHAF